MTANAAGKALVEAHPELMAVAVVFVWDVNADLPGGVLSVGNGTVNNVVLDRVNVSLDAFGRGLTNQFVGSLGDQVAALQRQLQPRTGEPGPQHPSNQRIER